MNLSLVRTIALLEKISDGNCRPVVTDLLEKVPSLVDETTTIAGQ